MSQENFESLTQNINNDHQNFEIDEQIEENQNDGNHEREQNIKIDVTTDDWNYSSDEDLDQNLVKAVKSIEKVNVNDNNDNNCVDEHNLHRFKNIFDFISYLEGEYGFYYRSWCPWRHYEKLIPAIDDYLLQTKPLPDYLIYYCNDPNCNCLSCQFNFIWLSSKNPKMYYHQLAYTKISPYKFAFQWKLGRLCEYPVEIRDQQWYIKDTNQKVTFPYQPSETMWATDFQLE
jgi:hypothetical protein